MHSKLKLKRKVPDKNDMQSLEGREREKGGALDVCLGIGISIQNLKFSFCLFNYSFINLHNALIINQKNYIDILKNTKVMVI